MNPSNLLISFIVLAVYIATIIVGMDCIWRVERRLKLYLLLLTGAVVIFATLHALGIVMAIAQFSVHELFFDAAKALAGLLIFISFLEMYRIIRLLDKER
jgi:hypothetical protein